MVSAKQAEHFKRELTARIAELERIISNAEQETMLQRPLRNNYLRLFTVS
jgi:hypothetical protein